MLKLSAACSRNKNLHAFRSLSTVVQHVKEASEYSEVAEYPPIKEQSYKMKKATKTLQWHEKIKKIGTIEEKLIEINLPRYYGYKCLMLDDKFLSFPYNTLPFYQYVTNTEFVNIESPHAPKSEEEAKKVENFLNLIRSDIQDAFEFELDGYKKFFEIKTSDLTPDEIDRAKTSGIVRQLNRILTNALGADNRHLYEMDSDVDPRHDAFWFVGGIDPTKKVEKMRAGLKWSKQYAKDPVNRPFQYQSTPLLALRHQHPLKAFEDIDFNLMTEANKNIPQVTIDPRALGFTTDHRHGTTTPGFWPGNVREYGFLSYLSRTFLNQRKNAVYGEEDMQNAIHSQGIMSSFSLTFAQACYQGFSTYNEMNYPLVSQTVITDGQLWSFYKYQLNTTCIHTNVYSSAPNYRFNKCWGTNEMKLFDQIDENGKLQGLNDDVLKNLIQFYINQPEQREHEMKPLLDVKEKKIADIEDPKRRDWLEKLFKHIMSNRPRHLPVPEIYNWEKIYKIDNDTRPLDRKLRFFELGIDPFKRRLNEHQPKYIPRHLRARGPHDKKKWEETYYPLDHRSNIPKTMSHSMFGAPRDKFACLMDRKRKSYK